ncbi:hypothetical protein [Metabacillus litoralis]|uniref:hypothetical protein n=1 Tax=Metabacillus litoralis TaxID=152268 RepID=UPI00203BE41B|nr:hypothetical protein [Metabacillus litoralis]MCM3413527.1 hypothetical protein [Metabacillus litoralis]
MKYTCKAGNVEKTYEGSPEEIIEFINLESEIKKKVSERLTVNIKVDAENLKKDLGEIQQAILHKGEQVLKMR